MKVCSIFSLCMGHQYLSKPHQREFLHDYKPKFFSTIITWTVSANPIVKVVNND